MLLHRLEDVAARLASRGGKVVAGAGVDGDHVARAVVSSKRRQPRQRHSIQPRSPFAFAEIKPVRQQRLIRRTAAPVTRLIEHVLARLVIIGDLREPLMRGFLRQRFEHDRRRRQIIEQRLHLCVKQRQPMLDAGGAAAFTHRFVEHVVGGRGAEGCDVTGAKRPDRLRRELEFRHRHQIEMA